MAKPEAQYESLAAALAASHKNVAISKMFGMPSLKVNGNAFAGLFNESMVFKLTGEPHAQALKLKGAQLFDPSGRNRPMKEWVEVPAAHFKKWHSLADEALQYVSKLPKK